MTVAPVVPGTSVVVVTAAMPFAAEWVAKAIPSVFCTVAQPVLVVPAELESSEDAGVGAVAKTMRGARPADPRFSGAPPPSIAENSTVACATDTVASR